MRIAGLPALLHYVCSLVVTVSSQFPSSLEELCPCSSFCDHNTKTINVSNGYQTCCRSCSCDSDCGLKRNCCFYEGDYYKIEEKGETQCSFWARLLVGQWPISHTFRGPFKDFVGAT
ncbi:hypothetical protein DPMN_124284 [Dreissena polymorpha]|uniref:Uncharacterized protein n=1 Tax=Dreissena polymorpha TaxID=45954 RepID=A0A9D4GSE1_DREPO|nr:hypothetical protein DPMN_124284 [Dreissena polymorpha]